MGPIKRSMVKAGDTDLFVRDTNTKKPALVCLHGLWGRGETWIDFINHYGNEYRIIAPDLRGHGLSDKPDSFYTIEEMAEDVHNLIVALGLERPIVFGHSMGGGIAACLAARYPKSVSAIAILDKSTRGWGDKSAHIAATIASKIEGVDPVTSAWRLPFASLSEAKEEIARTQGSALSIQYFMNSLVETVDGYSMMYDQKAIAAYIANDRDWHRYLADIACPALLIRSSSREAVSDEDLARMEAALAHCMSFTISHPDHNIQLGNKEEFYRLCDKFLAIL